MSKLKKLTAPERTATERVVNYIDTRIENQPYGGAYIDDQNTRHSADFGAVIEWWPIMKAELLRMKDQI